MMMLFNVLCYVAVLLVFVVLLYHTCTYIEHLYSLRHFPPGPFPLPYFGNLHQIDTNRAFDSCLELSKKYGAVFSVSFGMKRVVIVSAIEPAREALLEKAGDFSGRPLSPVFKILTCNRSGVVMTDYGSDWAGRRKISQKALKTFRNCDKQTIETIKHLSDRIEENLGCPIDVVKEIRFCLCNTMVNILFGKYYTDMNDKELLDLLNGIEQYQESVLQGDTTSIIPFLSTYTVTRAKESAQLLGSYVSKLYDEYRQNIEGSEVTDHFSYLIKASSDPHILEKNGLKELSRVNIENLMVDMLFGAIDTISTNITWLLLRLLHHPKYFEDALEEIRSVIGIHQYPTMKDRASLPKVQAMIQESLRLTTGVFSLQHKATKDSSLGGHSILKGTELLFDMWNIQRDKRHWDDPWDFKPYRFIDGNGHYNAHISKSFLPFLLGKRSCYGEQEARAVIFLIITRLIVDYKIQPYQELPKQTEGTTRIGFNHLPYQVIFQKR